MDWWLSLNYNTKIILFALFLVPAIERIINTFTQKESVGNIKYGWLTYLLLFTYFSSVLIAVLDFFIYRTNINFLITFIGSFLVILGIILRRATIKTLGKNWSIHIKEITKQDLIIFGPYKNLRHPYYLAVMLELSGVALYFNSLFSLIFVMTIHLGLICLRIILEEKVLIRQFGDRYLKYQKEKWIF